MPLPADSTFLFKPLRMFEDSKAHRTVAGEKLLAVTLKASSKDRVADVAFAVGS